MTASSKPPFAGEVRRVRLGELISPAKVEKCGRRILPILSITKDEGIVHQKEKFKKRVASADVSGYKIVPKGKLVQGIHIDEGNFAIQNLVDYGVVSPAYKVWDVNDSLVMPEYLAAVLRSARCVSYYRKMLSGTVHRRGRMSNELFFRLDVPLPSLLKQKESLEMLDSVRRCLVIARRQLSLLDELVKSRFVEMFGDSDIAFERLDDVAEVQGGLTKNRRRESLGLKLPYLRVANVLPNSIDLSEVKVIGLTEQECMAKRLKPGDLLIVEGNGSGEQIGRSAIWNGEIEPCTHQNHLIRVRFGEKVLPVFAQAYLSSSHGRGQIVSRAVNTSGLYTLSTGKIRSLIIPVPPLSLQCEFAAFAAEVAKSQVAVRQQIEKLRTLYDSLAQDYFG